MDSKCIGAKYFPTESLESSIAKSSRRNLESTKGSHSGTTLLPDEELPARKVPKKVVIFIKLATQVPALQVFFSIVMRALQSPHVLYKGSVASEQVSRSSGRFLQNVSEESIECF